MSYTKRRPKGPLRQRFGWREGRDASWRLPLTVLALVVAISACSSTAAKPVAGTRATTTSTALSATTTAKAADAETAILTQWKAAQEASVAASKDPGGPQVNLLVDFFVDPALSFLRQQYAAYARDGLLDIGTLDLGQPRVQSLATSQAVVVSCLINRLQLIVKATGKPVPGRAGDPTPTPNGIRSTLLFTPSGVWKLADSTVQDGSCTGL